MKEITYKCRNCGKIIRVSDGKVPLRCDKPMEQLPIEICTQPAHAETARPMNEEDVCDNRRGG